VLSWRIWKIRRAFGGIVVPGKITKITLFRDRGYLHYPYQAGAEAVQRLQVGPSVDVVVRRDTPTAGFVSDIYDI